MVAFVLLFIGGSLFSTIALGVFHFPERFAQSIDYLYELETLWWRFSLEQALVISALVTTIITSPFLALRFSTGLLEWFARTVIALLGLIILQVALTTFGHNWLVRQSLYLQESIPYLTRILANNLVLLLAVFFELIFPIERRTKTEHSGQIAGFERNVPKVLTFNDSTLPLKHVVILIHGIRDRARWQAVMRQTLREEGLEAAPTNYGRFDLIRFLVNVRWCRKRAIRQVERQLRIIIANHPGASFSIIAHSFGTFITTEILKENTLGLTVHRIIFCGSVLPYDYKFEDLKTRFDMPILNEVGTKDIWPAVAASITWGYGSAGTYGFNVYQVLDRWHDDADHGSFLSADFCRKYWIPWLLAGEFVYGSQSIERPKWYFEALSIIPLRYLVPALLLTPILVWLASTSF
jgi:hypothetical protein